MSTADYPIDILQVPCPEPGFHYRWLDYEHPQVLNKHLRNLGGHPGYVLCKGKTRVETIALAERLGFSESWVNERGWIVNGGLVLAKIPLAEAQRRREEKLRASRGRIAAMDEQFIDQMDELKRRGVKAKLGDAEELMERKKHALRQSNPSVSLAGIDVPSTK